MAKIMIVDDDPAGQRLIKYMLTPVGHEIISASNGLQALQMANQQAPDLVILDVMLPGLDGFEVCRRMRTSATTAHTPIIILSGKSQTTDRDTGLKMGANEYLVKPVDRDELTNTVSQLLEEAQGSKGNKTKVYAFIGARGGVGTSTVTVNVAAELAKSGKLPVLIDMNPYYSSVGELLGIDIDKSVARLFKDAAGTVDVKELNSLMKTHSSGLKLLWGQVFPDEADIYKAREVKAIFTEIEGMADYVIVDIPASPSDNSITALTIADEVILVVGTSNEFIERMGNVVTRLTRFGVDSDKIRIVVVDKSDSYEAEVLSASGEISGYPLIGFIHSCKDECAEAEMQESPVVMVSPDAAITKDIKDLVSSVVKGQKVGVD